MANTINVLEPSVCFGIQKIIAISPGEGSCKSYQVQWAPTWISGVHLVGCEDLIEQFEEEQNKIKLNIKVEVVAIQDGRVVILDDKNDTMQGEQQLTNNDMGGSVQITQGSLDGSNYDNGEIKPVLGNDQDDNNVDSHSSNVSNECVKYLQNDLAGVGKKSEEKVLLLFQCDELINNNGGSNQFSASNINKLSDPVSHLHKEDTIDCRICLKAFASTCELEMHFKNAHGLKRKCKPEMYYIDNSSFQGNLHTSKGKAKRYKFKCDICEKLFRDNTDLSRHRSVHTEERPFECNICQKKFKQDYVMKRHLDKHLDTQHSQKGIAPGT